MAGIGEIIALAKAFGGSGGGGGSGVLVITIEDNTMDKTWQEIYDAMITTGAVITKGNSALAVIDCYEEDGAYYVDDVNKCYAASSANGYPVYSN